MAYKYSKLGYGNAEDVEAAIALGLIDGKDIIITKDTSEFIYVRDDLSIQKVAPRTLCFDSIPVQQSAESGRFFVEPFQTQSTNFQWTEF